MSWQRDLIDPTLDSRPLPRPRPAARRWPGLAGVAFGLGLIAVMAWSLPTQAETIHIGGVHINGMATVGTSVTLSPSAEPGVLAVVIMENRHVNDGADTGSYPLVMGDLAVEVRFIWDADPVLGSDRIVVTPPLGVTCAPEDCGVTVMEGFTGQVVLFDWRGM